MTGNRYRKHALLVLPLALFIPGSRPAAGEEAPKVVSIADCTFEAAPEEHLARQARVQRGIYERVTAISGKLPRAASSAQAAPPLRSFIDVEIFGRLAGLGITPARLSTDEEFMRRIQLDLTGRIPSSAEARAFLADRSADKRDQLIDRLLASPEFIDRWTMWLGDLVQNTAVATNVNRQILGRNAFHDWIRRSVAEDKSLRDIAWEAVATAGNTFDGPAGAANFPAGAVTPMGPAQDTYDTMLVRSSGAFLGLAHYDCLLCHDGRGHLDQISLWGAGSTRIEAERMAAFFSRMRLNRRSQDGDYDVLDVSSGQYDLNTNFGNRPARAPLGSLRNVTPQYRVTGATPANGDWREAFANNMVKDPMFARNLANRLWKHFFGLGLVDPVDTLDPVRLDPANPPRAPWSLQATHPLLLEKLAKELEGSWFNLREFIRLVARSSAYQLSSRYDGEWKIDYVALFARHYPRRLEGEEIHDAIAKATGVPGRYTVQGWAEPVEWAVQLPEPVEPRSNGAVAAFMNAFLRGNRDTQPRSQSGSILQQLNLMNDPFVLNRVRMSTSPALQAISRQPSNEAAIEEIFLSFLSRRPTGEEKAKGFAYLGRAATAAARTSALEDLAWAATNKLEFLFSY